jgi:phage terminase large subunit GpA-like protein
MGRNYMAVKGASLDDGREIFSPPKVAVDTNRLQKAHKYGLRPFMVGTQRAKDLMLGVDAQGGRIKLEGTGPGRMHWYKEVRTDYWEQITSEVKAPHRTVKNKKVWQKKSGVRNEALDCEVYALHAARSIKLNLWKEERWLAEESRIRQPDLLSDDVPLAPLPEQHVIVKPKQPAPSGFFNAQTKGFSSTKW